MKNFKNYGKKHQGGWFGIASLVVSAIGLYKQNQANQEAASQANQQAQAQTEANAAQQRAANVQAQQDRVRQLREARIARARIISSSVNSGVGLASTGVTGATGAVSSNMGENIGSINVAQSFAQDASAAYQRGAMAAGNMSSAQAQAQQWQSISGLAYGAFDVAEATPSRTVSTTEFLKG